MFELIYHGITTVYAWGVMTAIMGMGAYFTYYFAKFYPVSENCDVDKFESSKYSNLESLITKIPDGTYTECLATVKTIFEKIDLNNDQFIDRCEDAKFLYAINDKRDYAMNYAGEATLSDVQAYCKFMVIDAFDEPHEEDQFWVQNIISRVAGVFPFNYLFFSKDRGVVYWLKDAKADH